MYDAAVIGGGFYGCAIAAHLRRHLPRVVLFEQEADLLLRASLRNQARVHNGYHYPRSLLTALRSHANFARFVRDYRDCIDDRFDKYYAVARQLSKVTAQQFATFCRRIDVPLSPAPAEIARLFDPRRIEAVFRVEEYAFDAVRLRNRLRDELQRNRVEVRLNTTALRFTPRADGCLAVAYRGPEGDGELHAGQVIHCTYSQLNQTLAASGLPVVPLKHEVTELALVEVPGPLRNVGMTVMCGPFFSFMPFPPRGLHTLSHVSYTPHQAWEDRQPPLTDAREHLAQFAKRSQFEHMRRDAARHLPLMADCRYVDSLWEIKAVLPASEHDDSRPILFKRPPGMDNLLCVLGSKLDNIYDALGQLDALFARREAA